MNAFKRGTLGTAKFGSIICKSAMSCKWCKIGDKLLLFIHRKLHACFTLVPKLVILNDLEQHNGCYFALFHQIQKLWKEIAKNVIQKI